MPRRSAGDLHCNINSQVWLLQLVYVAATATSRRHREARSHRGLGDGDPGSDEPAPFNQQTDVGEARAVNPAPTKLYDQHNTQQAMPVHTRTRAAAQSPLGRGARAENRA